MLKVYTSTTCPWCEKAKSYLKSGSIPYEEILLTDDNTEAIEFMTSRGHRSIPQIYIDDSLFVVGGYQGLSNLTYDEIKEKIVEHQTTVNQINQLGSL